MTVQLSNRDWAQLVSWVTARLNAQSVEADQIDEAMFIGHEVHVDVIQGFDRYLLVQLNTDDDPTPPMLYLVTDAENITNVSFAAWSFDTTTTELTLENQEVIAT